MAHPDIAPSPGEVAGRSGWWRWAFVGAYALAIFIASSISTVPGASRFNDKLLHGAAYGALCGVLLWAWTRGDVRRVRGSAAAGALVVCLLYGYSDEVHQRFVPGRHYDLWDLLADGLGAAAVAGGLAAWGIISRGRTRSDGL